MSSAYRPNRKTEDADLIKLNSIGFSLATIAKKLGCHPTTVTIRLKALDVSPADTRRTFMEDIFTTLSSNQQDWVASQLSETFSIKDFVRQLILDKYTNRSH